MGTERNIIYIILGKIRGDKFEIGTGSSDEGKALVKALVRK